MTTWITLAEVSRPRPGYTNKLQGGYFGELPHKGKAKAETLSLAEADGLPGPGKRKTPMNGHSKTASPTGGFHNRFGQSPGH